MYKRALSWCLSSCCAEFLEPEVLAGQHSLTSTASQLFCGASTEGVQGTCRANMQHSFYM